MSFSVRAQEGKLDHFPKQRKRGGGKEKRRRGEEKREGKESSAKSFPDQTERPKIYEKKKKKDTASVNLQTEGTDKIAKQNTKTLADIYVALTHTQS